MSQLTAVLGLLVVLLILISVHAGAVDPVHAGNNSSLNITSRADRISLHENNPALNISGSLLTEGSSISNTTITNPLDNVTDTKDQGISNQTIPAGNINTNELGQNQSFTKNPSIVNNSPVLSNQSPGASAGLNRTDINQTLSGRNATNNLPLKQPVLNETLKNQTIPDNNKTIVPIGWDEALSLLLLQHANDTPLPARGMETILTVGNPSYHVEHLFCNRVWVGWVEWKPQGDYAMYWIRLYNLESGQERVIPVDGMKLENYPPSMDGENIVYTGDTPGLYGSAIYLYNITTNETTLLAAGDQDTDKDFPVIAGHYVAYTVERYDWNYTRPDGFVNMYSNIQLIDLFTGRNIPISPVSNETRRYTPSISGENVVWETSGWDTQIPGFELYNIPTGTLSTGVANTGDLYARPPTIDKDRIVFDCFQTDNWDYDIFLYNITTGKETNLTPLTFESNQQDGSIHGDYVVYINDEYSNSPGLHLLNLATGITSVISSRTGVSRPEAYGNHIFWSQYDGSTWKYMMFTPGDPEPPVKADFTVNNTVGGLPFTVLFTDKSSGSVMTHHWEFGDGNDSYEVNPVHTYTTPGRYDVSLTVSSPHYRDNMYVPQMITAGAAPHASFVMDPPSGVVGLTVHFTDTSTGYNDQWLWDFGDNSLSTSKNTSHRYLSPGDYTVTLTSGNRWGTDSATGSIKVINATFGETPILLPGLTAYSACTRDIVIPESGLTGYTCTLWDNSTRVDIIPEKPGLLPSFSIFSENGTTFLKKNNTISGTVKNIRLTSADLTSGEFSDHTSVYNWLTRRDEYLDEVGSNSTIQFSVDLPGFEPGSSIDTAVCRQYTVEEAISYMHATQAADWADGPDNIAYVLHCTKNNLTETGPATITMSVSHEWIVNYSQFTIPEHRFKLYKVDETGQPLYDDTWNYLYFNVTAIDRDPSTQDYQFLVTDPEGINVSQIGLVGVPFDDPSNLPVRLVDNNTATPLPTSVTFAVNSDYIDYTLNATRWHYVQEPMTIIRVDDAGATEVLKTKFLYYDPVRNVDVFSAYSPHGLSEFGLAPVYTAGSPLQLLYLSFKERITDPLPPVINEGTNSGGNLANTGAVNHNSLSGGSGTSAVGGGAGAGGGIAPVVSDISGGTPESATIVRQGETSDNVPPPVTALNGPPALTPIATSSVPPNHDMAKVASQAPGSSIYTLFIEAAAMVSVILIVVFSVSLGYRRRKED